MVKESEYRIGEFLYGIPSEGLEDYYKDTPDAEMVFIHNGYISPDGYGILIGFISGEAKKSTGLKNFMWGGSVRVATEEERLAFIKRLMYQDRITDY